MPEISFSGDGPEVYEGARHALIDSVTGERVEVHQSAIRSLNAASAHVHQSAVQQLTGESVTVQQSMVLRTRGNDVSLRECMALGALGGSISAENCRTVLLLSPSVSGNVQAVITPRTAFALGVGFFFGRHVLRLAGRLLGRLLAIK